MVREVEALAAGSPRGGRQGPPRPTSPTPPGLRATCRLRAAGARPRSAGPGSSPSSSRRRTSGSRYTRSGSRQPAPAAEPGQPAPSLRGSGQREGARCRAQGEAGGDPSVAERTLLLVGAGRPGRPGTPAAALGPPRGAGRSGLGFPLDRAVGPDPGGRRAVDGAQDDDRGARWCVRSAARKAPPSWSTRRGWPRSAASGPPRWWRRWNPSRSS